MIEASVAIPRLPQPAPMYSPQDQTEMRRLIALALDTVSEAVRELRGAVGGEGSGTLLITGGSASSTFSGGLSQLSGGSA